MKRTQRTVLSFLLMTLAFVSAIFIIYLWQERFSGTDNKPIIICPSETISASVESLIDKSMLLKDITAIDVEDGDITSSVVVESVSQFVEEGHCIITYAAFDSANNVTKLTRHLFLTDYVHPRFRITEPLEFNYSSTFSPLSVVGAYDCIEGDISDRVKMSFVNQEESITSVGAHMVEFRVTNSLGDVAVLQAEVDVFDRTYTETRMTPVVKLTDYIIYVDQYSYIDPSSYIKGVTLGGVLYDLSEYHNGSIVIDDVGVDVNTPGVYKILYTCDNRGDYYGSSVLIVIVSEVNN